MYYSRNTTYYFIPSALSPKPLIDINKKMCAATCEPLVLSFECGVVPQVYYR